MLSRLDKPPASRRHRPAQSDERLHLITLAVDRAAGLAGWPSTCLHRSWLLHRWLSREGYSPQLRLGVSLAGGGLNAHAWVEVDGRVVAPSAQDLSGFSAFNH